MNLRQPKEAPVERDVDYTEGKRKKETQEIDSYNPELMIQVTMKTKAPISVITAGETLPKLVSKIPGKYVALLC